MTKPPSPFDYRAFCDYYGNPLHSLIPGYQKSVWMARVIEQARETQPSFGTMFGISNKETSISPKQFMKRPSK
jgi:hypothetical protein